MPISEVRRFRRALRRLERITHAQLKGCCARVTLAQCLVLLEIDECGELTVSGLAAGLRLDNSTLSRTIEGLVRRGLVVRLREEEDRRVVQVRLTPEGDRVCRAIHEENDGHYLQVFDKIPASRRGTVIRQFEILVRAFLDYEAEVMSGAACAPRAADRKETLS